MIKTTDPDRVLFEALHALFQDDRRRSIEALLKLALLLNHGESFPDTASMCNEFLQTI